jgi:thioredoxin 1
MKQMIKYSIIIILFLLIINCKKKDNSNVIPDQNIINYKKYQVTFIELGSVKCIPCKMMQPVMKQIEEKYKDQVKVVFYDVWTEKDASMAQKFKIKVIPTQVFLDKEGIEYFRHEGYFPFEELEKILNSKGVQ